MKLKLLKSLYYYEVPTLFLAEDKWANNYLFVLLNDDKKEYIGKKLSAEGIITFLTGEVDLKILFEKSETNYYLATFQSSEEIEANIYKGIISDDMLPEAGLDLIPPDLQTSYTIKKNVLKKIQQGSQKSEVGQLERITQDRVIKLFENVLEYNNWGNWEERSDNSNIENEYLEKWLIKQGHTSLIIERVIKALKDTAEDQSKKLYYVNQDIYSLLRYGVNVLSEDNRHKVTIQIIDWQNPLNNNFAIAEEVTIKGTHNKRPDIVLYVNGIALGVLELKRSTVSVSEGIRQNLDNQKPEFIQSFFATVQYIMAGNNLEGIAYGAIGAKEKYFWKWKEVNEEINKNDEYLLNITASIREKASRVEYPLDKNIVELLNKKRFLEFLHDFIVYDRGQKKLSRHNQYFGVKAARDYIKRREGGIVWHTQGSGKSLTMVWLTKWIRENVDDSRVLIITDRDELDKQIEKVYKGVSEEIYRTKSGKDLLNKLNNTSPWLICSLVQKFKGKEEGDVDSYIEELRSSLPTDFIPKGDIFIFVDECHRTQSGKLHDAMKSLLPNALFFGFTGTPLLKKDKQTSMEVFGKFIHTYKFDEAVADKVVLDLRYEARDIEQNITSQERIDEWFDLKTRGLTDFAKTELKQKWGTLKKVFSSKSRLEKIVIDMMMDMEKKERFKNGRGNALLVSDSIYNACRYYELFQNAGLKNCAIVTSFVPSYADIKGEETGEGYTERLQRYEIYQKMLADYFNEDSEEALKKIEQFETDVKDKFVNEPAQMKLLIVVNKLLTGFDAPPATYLYIDKKLHDHGLFQAVCRVNRLDTEDKDYGYIIDYMDLFESLRRAFKDYTSGAFDAYEKADVEGLLKDRLKSGKERLEEALEAIKTLCEEVEPPKDTMAHIRFFCGKNIENPNEWNDTESKRVALYKLTISLIRAYANIADDMRDAGYTEKDIIRIKDDLKHFENLRKEIQLASGDYVDLKQYEPAMRYLIDSYIGAEESRVLSKFDDLSLVELLVKKGKDALKDLPRNIQNDQDAVSETIENNLRKVIIEESPTNPMYYEKMSVLLDELIRMRKEKIIEYEKYLQKIVELTRKVKKEDPANDYPISLNTLAKRNLYDNLGKNETLASELDKTVLSTKRDRWRDTKIKTKEVELAVTDVLKQNGITDESEILRIIEVVKNQKEY